MRKQTTFFSLATLLIFLIPFFSFLKFDDGWKSLFNGKDLSGWDTWIGPPLGDNGEMLSKTPVGLNKDPFKVFTIAEVDGEKVIRISGEKWGGISTKAEFENFHFQLMFKWGSLTWGQQKGRKKDSGLLSFAVGEHGADYGAWMRSQEFQIEEGNCGDYWGCAGAIQDVHAIKKSDSEYVYNAAGQFYAFKDNTETGRHCIKDPDAEKPSGEWNTLDLYCHGDTSVHVMNGKTVMVLYHSRQLDNGSEKPLTKGKLQIQSEGAEVFYKQIKVMPIKALPAGVLK